ncbi:MAG: hypothetical protein KA184_21235, partial [Candidatus Hydrogenedentes bacterium]|nr:hypothetical protein [Candidatus Hydrogenedentota bacterium]
AIRVPAQTSWHAVLKIGPQISLAESLKCTVDCALQIEQYAAHGQHVAPSLTTESTWSFVTGNDSNGL